MIIISQHYRKRNTSGLWSKALLSAKCVLIALSYKYPPHGPPSGGLCCLHLVSFLLDIYAIVILTDFLELELIALKTDFDQKSHSSFLFFPQSPILFQYLQSILKPMINVFK